MGILVILFNLLVVIMQSKQLYVYGGPLGTVVYKMYMINLLSNRSLNLIKNKLRVFKGGIVIHVPPLVDS